MCVFDEISNEMYKYLIYISYTKIKLL